jgi:hypothetical protein
MPPPRRAVVLLLRREAGPRGSLAFGWGRQGLGSLLRSRAYPAKPTRPVLCREGCSDERVHRATPARLIVGTDEILDRLAALVAGQELEQRGRPLHELAVDGVGAAHVVHERDVVGSEALHDPYHPKLLRPSSPSDGSPPSCRRRVDRRW